MPGCGSRVAALYDIHGNLPALEAVLDDVRAAGVERIVIGGDVVPGPMSGETLTALLDLDLPALFVHGNGERDVLAARAGAALDWVPEQARALVRWTADALADKHMAVLESWPSTLRLEVEGLGAVLFCHATPRSEREIFTARTPDAPLLELFEPLDVQVVVCGHTHMQFDRSIGGTRVVNAGSVGMPFGEPGAYWLLIGSGGIEMRRTDYDLAAAAERIRRSSYPQAEGFAEANVLRPPTAASMVALLERAALR